MSTNNLVDALSERIKFDLDKLQSNELEKIELDSFNLSYFWSQFGAAVQGLSNEVTKIGFACGQQPYPASGNLAAMLQDLVQSYTVMRDLYLVLPEEVGATVYQAVTSVMIDIVAALLAVVRSLSDLSEKGAKERLTLTGTFWEACAAVEKLPRNNLLATLGVIDGELGLAVDAQEELTTVNTSDHALAIETLSNEKSINTEVELRNLEESQLNKANNTLLNSSISPKNKFVECGWTKKYLLESTKSLYASESLEDRNRTDKEGEVKTAIEDSLRCSEENKNDNSGLSTSHSDEDTSATSDRTCNILDSHLVEAPCNVYSSCESNCSAFEKWVTNQVALNKPIDSSVLQSEIDEICIVIQQLENQSVNVIFKDMTDTQKSDKYADLKQKLSELLSIKKVLDSEPDILNQILSDKNCTFNINESTKNEDKLPSRNVSEIKRENLKVTPKQSVFSGQINNWSNLNRNQNISIIDHSVFGYIDFREWVDKKIRQKESPNIQTLEAELMNATAAYRKCKNHHITPEMNINKKSYWRKKRSKLLKRLNRLHIIKKIFLSHQYWQLDHASSSITNIFAP